MRITRTDIRRGIGEPTFTRGDQYFVRGKVIDVNTEDPERISGEVSGSGGRRYRVDVRLLSSPSGGFRFVSRCTCPVGADCKHVVALLLAAGEIGTAGQGPMTGAAPRPQVGPADPIPGTVRVWLDQWTKPGVDFSLEKTTATPSRDQLFYVFRRSQQGQAEIVPIRGYVKKDGSIGKNAQEYRGHTIGHSGISATADDATILARLGFFSTGGWPPRMNWPNGDVLHAFLHDIVATGRARLNDVSGVPLAWAPPRRVSLAWASKETGDQVIVARDVDDMTVDLLPFPEPVYTDAATGAIGFAETGLPPHVAIRLATAPPIPADAAREVADVMTGLGIDIPRPQSVDIQERTGLAPTPHLKLFGQDRKQRLTRHYSSRRAVEPVTLTYPCGQVHVTYEGADGALRPNEGPDIRFVQDEGLVIIRREFARETQIMDAIHDLAVNYEGFSPDFLDFRGSVAKKIQEADIVFPATFPGDDQVEAQALAFTAEAVPQLRAQGWQIEIDPSWPFRIHDGPVAFRTSFEPSGTDWFSVALTLDAAGQALDLTSVILQIVEILPVDEWGNLEDGFDVEDFLSDQILYPPLADGTRVPVPGEQLAPFVEAFLEAQGLVGFHLAESGRAAALAEALEGCGAPWSGGTEILELGKRLQRLSQALDLEPPPQLQAELRPYQRVGYGWLRALSDSGFGGALADDMGLGKTMQALALLAHRHLEVGTDRPSLLIVPTSLLGNWQREAARFAPGLKLLILHGPARDARFTEIADHHLIVTTYPLVNRDHEVLFAQEYDLAILDEAQAVKNPAAAVAKRIREIRARQRIALSGTPMENNLQELWSLYDWLIPGLLGDRKAFTAKYRRPIEQLGDRAKQAQLSSRIKPFLMRRTKEEVAADLPPKTVIDEIVPLERGQAALYESVRTAMDARVRAAIAKKGLSGSHITILDALLKLRQACCDPALVKLAAARKVTESAKRARLLELLDELVAEGRKVLIFSQFVEMLRLIEADVVARGWTYAMLHGQTKKRDAEVAKFQSGDVDLFLISLKAGGVGLNLTAADTVILYDPWWNPAVERQAMDRAHRIGQDKPVFVHRLIAENTVETAIQDMQARKQALADALFEGTGDGPLTLTEDDLTGLFGSR